MAAHIDNTANFIKNFCSHRLGDEDLRLFNVEECRIRKRDKAAHFANEVFHSTVPSSQEEIASKFNSLWELREKNWHELSREQKNSCDYNLNQIAPRLFREKMDVLADRKQCFESYKFDIRGVDSDRLKRELIQHGSVGINSKGEIVTSDKLTDRDTIVEIRYFPSEQGSDPEIRALVPDAHFEWDMKNSEDTRMRARGRKTKAPRQFRNGANEFAFKGQPVFGITMRSDAGQPHVPSSAAAPLPSASSSSSSSAANSKPGPVFSEYDEINGYEDPVPPAFLITLTSGDHKEHFHCFSLIAAMISQDAPINPMTRVDVPTITLDQIAKKIGVSPEEFRTIWKRANAAYPNAYQYADRREHRFQLFRELIYSDQGSASERKQRSEVRDLLDGRDDWKILVSR